jgi:hypothetical protein
MDFANTLLFHCVDKDRDVSEYKSRLVTTSAFSRSLMAVLLHGRCLRPAILLKQSLMTRVEESKTVCK